MSLEEIKEAIRQLSVSGPAEFVAWFDGFDAPLPGGIFWEFEGAS